MAGPESRFRTEIKQLLRPLCPISIENCLTTPGLPDVAIVTGWIELKILPAWPVRETTPLRIPHFTDDQKRWAVKWSEHGGRYWLVVKIKGEMFVFGPASAQRVGDMTKAEMIACALAYFPKKPTSEQLCAVFRA